ncbi:MAG TPA: MFS transporter [Burkholderiaceae bacterium]|nr:MFS transporter [Burkholderiaceae bacterium]
MRIGRSGVRSRSVGAAIAALGVTQIVGWGTTHYMTAILAGSIADGLGLSPTTVLGGFSWGLLVAGASASTSGRLMDRHGAGRVMMFASILSAAGLLVISLARGWPALFAGWTLIGLAMRSILYDGAFAALTVLAGDGARRAISLVTLFGGFASSVFWPIGAWLDASFGWRAALQVYALLNLLPCALLHVRYAGGPHRRPAGADAGLEAPSQTLLPAEDARRALALLAVGFTLHAFINSAIGAHLVMLLGGFGYGAAVVVTTASLMGPAQVVARVAEMSLQRRFSAVAVALPSIALMPIAFVAALALPVQPWAAGLFVMLYGCANGLMTIVRGTLPLAVFGSRGYGELLGRIAGPGLLAAAAAPVTLSALVEAAGPRAGLALLAACAFGALVSIAAVVRLVRRAAPLPPG